MGPITTSSLCFFSLAMLRSTSVRSSSLDVWSFSIMNHRYHFVGSALLSRTSMDITPQQKSENMFEGCESRVYKQFTLYMSYIPTSPAFTEYSRLVGHHLLIIGFVFVWWSQWLAPALVLPMIGWPSQAWKFWPPKWLRRRRPCGKSMKIHQEWESREVFFSKGASRQHRSDFDFFC